MSAFVKLGDIKGEASDDDHKDWVIIESMSTPIFRSIVEGAKDQQRTQGETTLGDIVLVRQMDKSTPKIQEACANGTFLKEVEIDFCTSIKNKEEPYYQIKLSDVILTSYGLHANASGDPLPTEELTLGYSNVEWTYNVIDSKTGDGAGKVATKYDPMKNRS
jgi:type VI secretion system secreted protein Hcp